MSARLPRTIALLLLVLLAGCGGSGGSGAQQSKETPGPPVLGQDSGDEEAQPDAGLGFPGFATKNTTRVGGADAVADAAGVAQAIFPSRSRDTRPTSVTLVDKADWRSAMSAAQLMSRPLRSPILFSDGDELPKETQSALDALEPTGSAKAGNAQVLRIGATARPKGVRASDLEGSGYAELAQAIDRLHTAAAGSASRSVVVAPSASPEFAMPAAAWAAKSGDPVLWADKDAVPAATREAIATHRRPRIYVLGPASVISKAAVSQLERLGTVRRISGKDPSANAIAFARFADGRFGWDVTDPGHGLVFASARRPLDAAAAAPLSASGTYGPLLLTGEATALARPLQDYLLDIQPGFDPDPVRGVYNHGWIIGDEGALSIDVQARIDALLEIQPVDPDA